VVEVEAVEVVVLVEVVAVELVVFVEGVPQGVEEVLQEVDVVVVSGEGADSREIPISCNISCLYFNRFVWMMDHIGLQLKIWCWIDFLFNF
jgi:hypothetical protein